jgi:hypothetical protein
MTRFRTPQEDCEQLEHQSSGEDRHAVVEPVFNVEFLIMAGTENEWDIANACCVAQAGPSGIDGALMNQEWRPRRSRR